MLHTDGKRLILLGLVSITILFLLYSRYQDSEIVSPSTLEPIQRLSYIFYIILILAFGAIAYGLKKYHMQKVKEKGSNILSIVAMLTWNSRAKKIFVSTFVIYGIFFTLFSGALVYQPDVTFSIHYNAKIPSGFIAPCCDAPGYMPKILVYLTEHIGLQIIPLNLVLQLTVSYLVALNMSIAINAMSTFRKEGGSSTLGAVTGLFIACPTCAGSFLSLFVGITGGVALGVALTQLQTVFIVISIPILLITPFIFARRVRNPDGSCPVSLKN